MKVFESLESAALPEFAVCLGNFDGVHLGHQALFAKARALGDAAAVTFEPHPGKVLKPELAPKLLSPLSRRLELMEALGLAAVVVQPFTPAYAQTQPSGFEATLLRTGARHLIVGHDFTYGARRGGNVETLGAAAAAASRQLHVVAPVTVDGVVVSSSRVREYLLEGRVEAARALLGRDFDLDGRVVPGDGRGRTIGVPTANVETGNELLPASGVYAVLVRLEGEGEAGWRAGAANVGTRPTFGGGGVTIEVHLLDFAGDLYGRALRVRFVERLREERRFPSREALVAQIRQDLAAARLACARR